MSLPAMTFGDRFGFSSLVPKPHPQEKRFLGLAEATVPLNESFSITIVLGNSQDKSTDLVAGKHWALCLATCV